MVRREQDADTDTGSNEGSHGVMDLISGMAEAVQEQATTTTQFVRQMQEQGGNNNRNHEGRTGNPDFSGWTDFQKSSPPPFKGEFDPKKEMKFMRIEQGDAPFEKFLAEYKDLAEHSSYLRANPDEELKCMHFVSSLNPKLKNMVAPMEITNFAILVNKCRLCNEIMAELEKDTQQSNSFKRKQSGFAKGSDNKGNKNDGGKKPKTGQNTGNTCSKCGKSHGNRPCLAGQWACYRCGKLGHFAKECPQLKKPAETPKPQTTNQGESLYSQGERGGPV